MKVMCEKNTNDGCNVACDEDDLVVDIHYFIEEFGDEARDEM